MLTNETLLLSVAVILIPVDSIIIEAILWTSLSNLFKMICLKNKTKQKKMYSQIEHYYS